MQMQLGQVDISTIKFDLKSRDELPQVLRGLQHIYITPSIREEVFLLLEKNISPHTDKKNGRPGMELWKIFVLGVVRLDLNWNYDRLHDEANHHKVIRQMLGHPDFFDEYYYQLQTLKDNVSLLTPELLDEINQIVVRAGHVILKKKENEALHGRCDSFVVETNVHFPTDINLLLDAMRKAITLTADLSERHELSEWRQSAYNIRHIKRLMRSAQNKKRSKAKTEEQKEKREALIVETHQAYITAAGAYLKKAVSTLKKLNIVNMSDSNIKEEIESFMRHAERQISQIERRVIHGEKIPHNEKVFSIFEPHTEWIVKGKAGVPVELGLKVCIQEDQHQFILYHQVMQNQTDDQVAISMVDETQKRFPNFKVNSFDKGFHSPNNQEVLSEKLEFLALPRKGKLSKKARAIESSKEFRKARHKHSAVESAINALENHGLDRCPDHGICGFKRYVALAVVARNLQSIGVILQMREQKREAWSIKRYYNHDGTHKRAA
nr:ISNCY family transposase [Parachlamydiaceae bacterium]